MMTPTTRVLLLASATAAASNGLSVVSVVPWGDDSFRVRVGAGTAYNGPGTLEDEPPPASQAAVQFSRVGNVSTWHNGNLILSLDTSSLTIVASRPNEPLPFAQLVVGSHDGIDDGTCSTVAVEANDCCCSFGTCTKICSTTEVKNMSTLSVTSLGADGGKAAYFGFGEHENGKLDQTGLRYVQLRALYAQSPPPLY